MPRSYSPYAPEYWRQFLNSAGLAAPPKTSEERIAGALAYLIDHTEVITYVNRWKVPFYASLRTGSCSSDHTDCSHTSCCTAE